MGDSVVGVVVCLPVPVGDVVPLSAPDGAKFGIVGDVRWAGSELGRRAPPQSVHPPAVRRLNRGGEFREDLRAGHRHGRAGKQTGDLREDIVSSGSAFRLCPAV